MVLSPFTFNKDALLPRDGYGGEIYLEITCFGKVSWENLTMTFSTAPSFDFVLKTL